MYIYIYMLTCPENLCQTRGVSLAPNWPACSQKVFPGCSHSHQVSVIHHLNELRSAAVCPCLSSLTCLLKKSIVHHVYYRGYPMIIQSLSRCPLWPHVSHVIFHMISQLSRRKNHLWGCHHRGDCRWLASHGTASGGKLTTTTTKIIVPDLVN